MTRKHTKNVLPSLLALATTVIYPVSCARIKDTPLAWRLSETNRPIPNNYSFYYIFLRTSGDLSLTEGREKYQGLARDLAVVARAGSSGGLAVWVDEPSGVLSISRGRVYADKFRRHLKTNLNYEEGPYLIISTLHPSQLGRATPKLSPQLEALGIGFRDMTSAQIAPIFTRLSVWLREYNRNHDTAKPEELLSQIREWVRMDLGAATALRLL